MTRNPCALRHLLIAIVTLGLCAGGGSPASDAAPGLPQRQPSIPHGRAATLAATARSCAPYDLSIALSNNPRRTGVIAAQTTPEPVAVQAAHA